MINEIYLNIQTRWWQCQNKFNDWIKLYRKLTSKTSKDMAKYNNSKSLDSKLIVRYNNTEEDCQKVKIKLLY
jgi:hypothetical protein